MTAVTHFITGKKIFDCPLKLEKNDILIVEGLHALNEEITRDIPKEDLADALINMANEHGGGDNITVALIYR